MSESDKEIQSKPKAIKKSKPIVSNSEAIIVKHPKTSVMVLAAISILNEKGGSSLHAIKKYISAKYNIDSEKKSSNIKKFLKNAVLNGELKQTKGRGAVGSFKIGGIPAKLPKKQVQVAEKASVSESTKAGSIKENKKKVTASVAKKPKVLAIKTVTKTSEKSAVSKAYVSKSTKTESIKVKTKNVTVGVVKKPKVLAVKTSEKPAVSKAKKATIIK